MGEKSEQNDPDLSEFGREVLTRRSLREITQQDLSARIGCSRTSIAMLESGKMPALTREEFFPRLARILGDEKDGSDQASWWSALADRSRPDVQLATTGAHVTEEHRRVAAALQKKWSKLSPEALRAISQVLAADPGPRPKKAK